MEKETVGTTLTYYDNNEETEWYYGMVQSVEPFMIKLNEETQLCGKRKISREELPRYEDNPLYDVIYFAHQYIYIYVKMDTGEDMKWENIDSEKEKDSYWFHEEYIFRKSRKITEEELAKLGIPSLDLEELKKELRAKGKVIYE